MTREKWLQERLSGIGASEAAAVLGVSPYLSNEQLWRFKTGIEVAEDISDKPYVMYGIQAEEHLRNLFALDFPEYVVGYKDFDVVKHPEHPFIFATLDGRLTERESGRLGVLEIKTTEIFNPSQWNDWNNKIPDHYYIQVLHQMLATGFDFAVLKAQIRWRKQGELNVTTRHYFIERSLHEDDIEYLEKEEVKFWGKVIKKEAPNLKLPTI